MENLIFCLNATTPVFVTMIFGYLPKRVHLFDVAFLSKTNKFAFVTTLPVLLSEDISTTGLKEAWDTPFVIFCFLVTPPSMLFSVAVSYRLKGRSIQEEFVQASYRGGTVILGTAFTQDIYRNSGMTPLMIIVTAPLYDTIAVIVLSFMKPRCGILRKELILQAGKGIFCNPIILGVGTGMLWPLLRIPQPVIPQRSLHNLETPATPLDPMAIGDSFGFYDFYTKQKPALICNFVRLILFTAILLPIVAPLGFVNDKLVAVLVMLGSAATVSCYIMARNIGHKGTLSSNVVMTATLGSAFVLTIWLYILKSLGTL